MKSEEIAAVRTPSGSVDVRIVNDFLAPHQVDALNAEWPARNWSGWYRYDTDHQRKSVFRDARGMPQSVLRHLSRIATAWTKAEVVPDLSFWGSGMCTMIEGDFLSPHLDHDIHPFFGLQRSFNVIVFLGGDGDLVLGEGANKLRIAPTAGRLVKFSTTDTSVHEVEPVTEERRTLSVYFYDRRTYTSPAYAKRPKAQFTHDPSATI